MYLKALEIQGFKSFPDRTVLHFEKAVTAIVGPNGSGKSNISDALLWVMGEQRSKALRGGKMEDVVFGGTEKRSPMGFAQVTLVLDNAGGLFPVDAPEVAITRRYYRTGESEYSINRESVRLRDIVNLLMDTGLGRDGYSVIGQGRIAEIVSVRSTDRREIFEEAAGIARYRARKEEAERKLLRVEDDLTRVNDKISELDMQVGPLEKQAATAKKYLLLRDEQRNLEISVWMDTLDRLERERGALMEAYSRTKNDLSAAQRALEDLYAASENYSEQMRRRDVEIEGLRERQGAAEAAAAECDSASAVLENDIANALENISRLREELASAEARSGTLRAQAAERRARAAEINERLSENASRAARTRAESEENARRADGAAQGLAALVARENAAADALTGHTAALAALAKGAEDLKSRAEAAGEELRAAETRDAELAASLREAEKSAAEARERTRELENVINGHRMLLQGREQAVKELTAELNRVNAEQHGAEARAKLLSDMEREFEGLGKAVRTVMTAASRGTLRGVYGPVAKLISVPDRFTVAVETALGGALQHIVVENQDCGRAAIELLKRGDAGRATFLPLDTVRPGTLQHPPESAEGYLGVASALVRCEERYRSVIENLLGRTVVAQALPEAIAMSRASGNRLRIVTLDGQMINAGGSMTGGSAARNVGILSRANELKQLRERVETLEARRRETAGRLSEAERVLAGAKYDSEAAAAELAEATEQLRRREAERDQFRLLRSTLDKSLEGIEREQAALEAGLRKNAAETAETERLRDQARRSLEGLREEISAETKGREDFEQRRRELSDALAALREEAAGLESERDAALRGAEDIETLLRSLSGDSAGRERSIAAMEERRAEQERALEEKRGQAEGYRAVAGERKADIARLREEKLQLEGQRTRSDREAQERNREILDLQNACARYEQKKQSAEMEEKQLLEKLRDSYELSRSEAQLQRRPLDDPVAAAKRVAELRREISRLGNVNVGAIDEYARVKERWDFLTGQRDDVQKARRDLVKIIADVTGEMKEIFVREFQAIAESFRNVFLELFGGGKAALELEEPEDPLGCGIEIRVQPPGKAVTSISLLSGGEKSFVAICLYFAIIRVRPAPFCIMDEIDAALDEANVERYAHYMRTLAGNTQFITITHHRATMEEADMLYGVTMQEKGVSTVLNIDLEEAEKAIS